MASPSGRIRATFRGTATHRARRLIIALLAAAFATLLPITSASSPAAAAGAAGTVLCEHNAHLPVYNAHGMAFYLRNPYWRGHGITCIRATGGTGFKVTETPRTDGHVNSYPSVMRGCIWRICTPRTRMPIQVRDIHRLFTTWHTHEGVPGMYNASFDIWLGKHLRNRNGSATRDGAELMIWLNYPAGDNAYLRTTKHRKYFIAGYWWYQLHWRGCDHRINVCWNYISYRLVHRRWKINNLNLRKFLIHSEHRNLIQPRWWLQTVGAGFEVWKGGRGLASTKFDVTLR